MSRPLDRPMVLFFKWPHQWTQQWVDCGMVWIWLCSDKPDSQRADILNLAAADPQDGLKDSERSHY